MHHIKDMDSLVYWLGLKAVRGVGNHLFLRLLHRFGSPFSVFQATELELMQVDGIHKKVASEIVKFRIPDHIVQDIEHIRKNGCTIVTFSDKAYPALLREIHDPPPFLYVFGTLGSESHNIAVVGSRNATQYGREVTYRLSADLAARGMTVVSGMARGIDTAAHQGALSTQGKTVAVLGCGLGTVYPVENRDLFHRIGRHGAVISEFPFLATPEPHHFPIRNRIISGMSLGTVIVEATHRSGSLITARLAGEQGRDVFAVPGSVTSFKSTGTHSLIKQGAKLVEHVHDIMDELSFGADALSPSTPLRKQRRPDVSPDEKIVLNGLSPYPVHIDRLIRQLSMAPGDVSSLLLHLELKGLVTQSPGKRFARAAPN